ncbi:unnamed protein product, partial [Laminaria digitata]
RSGGRECCGRSRGSGSQRRSAERAPTRERWAESRRELETMRRQLLEMRIRMEVQAEERDRTETVQWERQRLERLQPVGGMVGGPEQHAQPGTFMVSQNKPAPKLNDKTGGVEYFTWKKQFRSWAVSSSCEDALKETTNPIIFHGPNTNTHLHERNEVTAARRAHDGINHAMTSQSLLRNIYVLGSPSLAMALIRKKYVPSDDLDKHAYTREYINAEMIKGEQPALCFERMSIICEKLAEVGIEKTDHEINLHTLQCLSSGYAIDKFFLQTDRNLTMTLIEDRVRATFRELEREQTGVGSTAHVLVATGGGGP